MSSGTTPSGPVSLKFSLVDNPRTQIEEWFEDVNDDDGWIALVNFRDHVLEDFSKAYIDQYFVSGGNLNEVNWRTQHPHQFYEKISASVVKRIG